MKPIKTAIIPVVGYGTRCLPFSKAVPKEMMTVVDRPVVDYVVQEAILAGIEHIIFVTQSTKTCIENYFTQNVDLENHLEKRGDLTQLAALKSLYPPHIRFSSVRQPSASGLGKALLYAQHLIQPQEWFVVLLPDVLISSYHDLKTLMDQAYRTKQSQIMVNPVSLEEVSKYGVIGFEGTLSEGKSVLIQQMVEKPAPEQAPSAYAIVGRYVLPYDIFSILEQTPCGHAQEVQLTDGLRGLLKNASIQAYAMRSICFDCGHILGYLEASLFYALNHPKYSEGFRRLLKQQEGLL